MKKMTWDCREQPDFDELARLVSEVAGKPIKIRMVETETDQYAVRIFSGDELEAGDVVRVLTRNGALGYFGELAQAVLVGRGRYVVLTPDGEEHLVPMAYVVRATEAEADDYIERYLD